MSTSQQNDRSQNSRVFVGIFIPADIYLDKALSASEKLFWAEINALAQKKPCTATNKHFSDHLGITDRSVRRMIERLVEKGYVTCKIISGHIRHLRAIYPSDNADKTEEKESDEHVRGLGRQRPKPRSLAPPHVNTTENKLKNRTEKPQKLEAKTTYEKSVCLPHKEERKEDQVFQKEAAEIRECRDLLLRCGADSNFADEISKKYTRTRVHRNILYAQYQGRKNLDKLRSMGIPSKGLHNVCGYLRVAIENDYASLSGMRVD